MVLARLLPAFLVAEVFGLLLPHDSELLTRTHRDSARILSDLRSMQTGNDAVNMSGMLGYANVAQVLDDGSSMFWWFISRIGGDVQRDDTPLVLWLQGGPGCSSILGAFFEFGPFGVGEDLQLTPRPGSWAEQYHLLLVDNPFGAGFSFTTSDYVTNEYEVGKYIYLLLQKLVVSHPEFFRRELYIFGESYSGKYVPAVAYYILNWNANTTVTNFAKLPLMGIGIGDGITDPLTQLTTFSDYAFAAALIDESERVVVEKYQQDIALYVQRRQWISAWNATNSIVHFIMNQSGNINAYNFRIVGQYNFTLIQDYFNQSSVKAALNLPESLSFSACDQAAYDSLENDIMQSLVWMMPYLLNNTRVIIYNGQDDTYLNIVGFENWIDKIPWYGQSAFRQTQRTIWYANGTIAGYAKSYDNLTQLTVLRSGHMVPLDQLQNSVDMLNRFTAGTPWD